MKTIVSALALVTIIIVGWLWHHPLATAGEPCRGRAGIASYYGSEPGSITASGALFRPEGLSAAMPNRAMLGKHVRVTDLRTGRSVVVLVNDVGPARWTGRAIDLSKGAAKRLGIIQVGSARVCVIKAK